MVEVWGNTASAPLRRCRTSAEHCVMPSSAALPASPGRRHHGLQLAPMRAQLPPPKRLPGPWLHQGMSLRTRCLRGAWGLWSQMSADGVWSVSLSSRISSSRSEARTGVTTTARARHAATSRVESPPSRSDRGQRALTFALFFPLVFSLLALVMSRSSLPSRSLVIVQNFGPDIQKDVDTVKDDCFQCRAAAARKVPA